MTSNARISEKRTVGAVFFDRDGTLNYPAPVGEYIRQATALRLLPGAATAVRRVNLAGLLAVVVTNQRWLSSPSTGDGVYREIEATLDRMLAASGARLDATYTCPHALDTCSCRKPLPGLLLRAAVDLGVSMRDSFMIGDSAVDMAAGAATGVRTILLATEPNSPGAQIATHVAASITEGVDIVLQYATGRG
jgi:D-glycero-D-manno-heptose 1,7-bisphosphate phosphatase